MPAISIPLWFDWGARSKKTHLIDPVDFNPTLVRLGHPALDFDVRLTHQFQSHFGSIGAPDGVMELPRPIRISIPLWFDWGWA